MDAALGELRDLLQRHSVRTGTFTLASGATSRYYCDTKATVLSPRGSRLVGALLHERLARYDVEAVGGLAMGAAYLATAVAVASDGSSRPLYAFCVRPARKDHGLERAVDESFHPDGRPLLSPGRRLALVEDVVTTGGSVLQAVAAVRERGCTIAVVAAVVDRRAGGAARLREAGLDYFHLYQADERGTLSPTAG